MQQETQAESHFSNLSLGILFSKNQDGRRREGKRRDGERTTEELDLAYLSIECTSMFLSSSIELDNWGTVDICSLNMEIRFSLNLMKAS